MAFETPGAPTANSPTAETETELSQAAEAEGEGLTPADSSTADEPDAKEPESLLDVVKSVVTDKPEEAAASSTAEEEEGKEADPEGKADEAEPEGESDPDAKLPFHNHPRWKEVIAERDGFKEDAESYRNITGYMQEHGLSVDEVAEGFSVMAAIKAGTPEKLSEVRTYFAERLKYLDGVLGHTLPDDLQGQVDSGAIDEEAARELAQHRAADKLRTETAEREAKESAEQAEARKRSEASTAAASAVQTWEDGVKATDPDYSKKADLVEAQCLAIAVREGKPKTPEEAVALAKRAYAEVSSRFQSALPKPKPIVPAPRGSSANAKPEPKTLKDAIRGVLNA